MPCADSEYAPPDDATVAPSPHCNSHSTTDEGEGSAGRGGDLQMPPAGGGCAEAGRATPQPQSCEHA